LNYEAMLIFWVIVAVVVCIIGPWIMRRQVKKLMQPKK